jgi:hypothetical protein
MRKPMPEGIVTGLDETPLGQGKAMLGIILTLFAMLAALAFAFHHSDDKKKRTDPERRDPTCHSQK